MDSENSAVSVTSSVTRLRNASFVVIPRTQFLSAYPSSLLTLYENCEFVALSSSCDRALLEPLLPDVHRLHLTWLLVESPVVGVLKEVRGVGALKNGCGVGALKNGCGVGALNGCGVGALKNGCGVGALKETHANVKETHANVKETHANVKETRVIEGWKYQERISIACEANTFVAMQLRVRVEVLSKE